MCKEFDPAAPVFFDASCLFAGAYSPTGGSGFLLNLCHRGLLLGGVSSGVLAEAAIHLAQKRPDALSRFELLLQAPSLINIDITEAEWTPFVNLVGGKDAHVIAAALAAGAAYLITLDKALARRVGEGHMLIQAMAPGDFIRTVLPQHPDYPAGR